jgi:hypothetical protein
MSETELPCPFVYANGRKCSGQVTGWKIYGGRFEPARKVWCGAPRKVRLWCSEKWNHEGAANSWEGKQRMEFYPDKLPKPIFEAVFADPR